YTSLPFYRWPSADREDWLRGCQPPQRLKPGGRAASMSQTTQRSHMRSYGYLLDFCWRTGCLQSSDLVAVHVDPETIAAFLVELQTRVGSVTRHTYLSRIRRVA